MNVTILERFDLFKETFNVFGTFILKKSDEEIEYLVFEEFITYVTCYLHKNTLIDLLKNKFIDQYVFEKSILLRSKSLILMVGRYGHWMKSKRIKFGIT
ncbi:MAG: hypothetical protein ACLU5J_12235 [Christensenellales bacterium]